jgi:hypothetical protein
MIFNEQLYINNLSRINMKKVLIFLFVLTSFSLQAQQLSVFFDSDESTLSDKDKHRLDSLVGTFQTELFYDIKLVGHTDSTGYSGKNKQLSKARANAVYKYLPKRKNIRFLVITGKADASPVQTNTTIVGRAQNRRCDIDVMVSQVKKDNWKLPVQYFNVDNADKNILYTKNGCKIYVAPGTFNVRPTDTVSIQITEYKDPADFIAGELPMSYQKNEKTYMYESEQMMKIEAFVDTVPVVLIKSLELQCPDIDTSNGVHFYKFSGEISSSQKASKILQPGKIEVFKVVVKSDTVKTVQLPPVAEKEIQSRSVKPKEKETPENNQFVYGSSDKSAKKSGKGGGGKKASPNQIAEKPKVIELEVPKQSKIKIEPDTGKAFKIKPDTNSRFITTTDGVPGSFFMHGSKYDYGTVYCFSQERCASYHNACEQSYTLPLVNKALEYNGTYFFKPELMDLNSYYVRYSSFCYDGMELKSAADPQDLYTVDMKYKKKTKFSTSVVLKSFNKNPEYLPLKKTKWIINQPIYNKEVQLLKKARVSDFTIYHGYSEYNRWGNYYIEIKGESSLYFFEVRPKYQRKTEKRYNIYKDVFENRVRAFNDTIEKYIEDNKLEELYCLYLLTNKLSTAVEYSHGTCYRAACYPFEYFKVENRYYKEYEKCHIHNSCFFDYFDFIGWLKYYNENMELFQRELLGYKKAVKEVSECECAEIPYCGPKWQYTKSNPDGNTIVDIKLGEYNFDREMLVEKQQLIYNVVYLNEQRDTILKCSKQALNYRQPITCNHTAYTIIPGFNGLLKQTDPAILKLLPGKKNMLYFENYGRKYKLYLDLTNVETYNGTVFILKEITEQAETLEGLKSELEKID